MRPGRPLSFWPREHGAYVQLLGPLACALLFGPTRAQAFLLAAAACAAFLAHEPVLVLLGRRGARVRSLYAGSARLRLALLGTFVVGAAAWSVASSTGLALALLVPTCLSLAAAAALLRGHERALWAQLLSATTLVSFTIPVLVASGRTLTAALQFAAGWLLVHVTATCAARAYVYRRRDGTRGLAWATALAAGVFLASAGLYAAGWAPGCFALACAPFVLIAALLLTRLVTFKSPKALGWSLTAANLAAFLAFGLELLALG